MGKVDLYDNVYGDFASSAEAAVRRETYGEDLGQSSWLTAASGSGFADQLGSGRGSRGAGGGQRVGRSGGVPCRGARVSRDGRGHQRARRAQRASAGRGAGRGRPDRSSRRWTPAGRSRFRRTASTPSCRTTPCATSATGPPCSRRLASPAQPGGRALFTDAMVVTGPVSHEEIADPELDRLLLFVPPGTNERCCGKRVSRCSASMT